MKVLKQIFFKRANYWEWTVSLRRKCENNYKRLLQGRIIIFTFSSWKDGPFPITRALESNLIDYFHIFPLRRRFILNKSRAWSKYVWVFSQFPLNKDNLLSINHDIEALCAWIFQTCPLKIHSPLLIIRARELLRVDRIRVPK